MNRKNKGIILIILGSLLVCLSIGNFCFFAYQDMKAGSHSDQLLEELCENQDGLVTKENAKGEMPQKTFRGYSLVGIIKVPKVNLELPVLSQWSYDLLKVAPCRYSGSIENNDLIILGHNYRSHFTPLKTCVAGDRVEFLDVNNHTYIYEIEKTEELYKTELDRLTSSDYDLTIFTCTYGGQNRYVARCNLVKKD